MAGIILIPSPALASLAPGTQPPAPEWDAMSSTGRAYMLDYWWVAAMPSLAIVMVSLGFNLLGDGLRDVLDRSSGRPRANRPARADAIRDKSAATQ